MVPLVAELHDRLRRTALFVVALDKLRASRRVRTGIHQRISVVTVATNEEKSAFVGLDFDLIGRETCIAVSANPHGYLRRRLRRLGGCLGSEGRRGNRAFLLFKQLVSTGALQLNVAQR